MLSATLSSVVLLVQIGLIALLACGAALCIFGRDRRTRQIRNMVQLRRRKRDSAGAEIIPFVNLSDASRNRATDFAVGFRYSDAILRSSGAATIDSEGKTRQERAA